MTWSYRILKKILECGTIEYDIHEVYYDGEKPRACSVNADYPHGETEDELLDDVSRYVLALTRPTLDYDEFVDDGFLEIE